MFIDMDTYFSGQHGAGILSNVWTNFEPAEETSSVVIGMMEFIELKPKIQAVRIEVHKTKWILKVEILMKMKTPPQP